MEKATLPLKFQDQIAGKVVLDSDGSFSGEFRHESLTATAIEILKRGVVIAVHVDVVMEPAKPLPKKNNDRHAGLLEREED